MNFIWFSKLTIIVFLNSINQYQSTGLCKVCFLWGKNWAFNYYLEEIHALQVNRNIVNMDRYTNFCSLDLPNATLTRYMKHIVLFIYYNNCFHLNKMMKTGSCVTLLTLVWGWLCWTGWRGFRVAPVGAAGDRHKLNKGPPCCTGAACCCIVTEISHGDYHHLITYIIWKYWISNLPLLRS